MNNLPKISVVIPYSPEHTPERMLNVAIDSIKKQDVPTNIILIRDEDQKGPAWARNQGLESAETRFVAFLDADDLWLEGKLRRQLESMRDTGAGICIEGKHRQRNEFMRDLFLQNIGSVTSSILIDTDRVNVQFETELELWEDHLFILEAASQAGVCFCQDLVEIRKHAEGLSSRNTSELIITEKRKFINFVSQRVDQDLVSENEENLLKEIYYIAGRRKRNDREFGSAIRYLRTSLSYGISSKTIMMAIFSVLGYTLPSKIDHICTIQIPISAGFRSLREEGIVEFVQQFDKYIRGEL